MFDYKKKENCITIGYRINEAYWNKGIASNAIALMKSYLIEQEMLDELRAYVMPENVYSAKALIGNGFIKQNTQAEMENWGGREKVAVDIYTLRRDNIPING